MIDFKGTDFPPLESKKDIKAIENLLKKAVQQIDERNEILRRKGFKDLNSMYKAGKGNIPYWIIVIDEYADIISKLGRRSKQEFESHIQRIAQKGRSAGIHLVISTQIPRKEVVSGLIR